MQLPPRHQYTNSALTILGDVKFWPYYTVDSRYSDSLKYGHLDIPAIWLGTEC